MKAIDTPKTNKIGNMVAYVSPYGQCYRTYTVPRDPQSPAQASVRASFGWASRAWGLKLTDLQRERWTAVARQVSTRPWLGHYTHLGGQRLWVKINHTLHCVGKPPVDDPPDPVVFGPNPVNALAIVPDEGGSVRLLLSVEPVTEDLMVYGQAPCSRGLMKHRRVCYLGLLGPVSDGQSDITSIYVGRFGQPFAGQKVFIVTCQERNGWQGHDRVVSGTVPAAA
jgi:hypothetical protein